MFPVLRPGFHRHKICRDFTLKCLDAIAGLCGRKVLFIFSSFV